MINRWIVLYAVILHAVWGILLLFDHNTLMATAPHGLVWFAKSRYVLAIALLVISGLAFWSIHKKGHEDIHLIALLPQQLVMMASAGTAIRAISIAQFADGVNRPWAFIAADQCPAIIAALMHTLAILERFAPSWIKVFSRKYREG